MEIVLHFFKYFLKLIMKIEMALSNNKTNYLMATPEVFTKMQTDRILMTWHVFPSLVVSLLFSIKVLPEIWNTFAVELESNNTLFLVPAILLAFVPLSLINGFLIESYLTRFKPAYREFKESQKDANPFSPNSF
ncbi:MAG: hypothetical protein U0T73_08090 [Chitinophagales bacterium]